MVGRRPLHVGQGMREVMEDGREIQVMKDWSQSEGISIHHGLASPTEYNNQRAEWRIPITRKLEQLAQVLESSQLGDSPANVRDVGWEDVLDCIEQAKKFYSKKAEDNRLRGWIREGDVVLGILGRLTNLIPDQNGLTVVKASLAYVFQTWHTRISNVNSILQELDDIPGVLANIFQICNIYDGEISLKNLVWDFYGILVDCLLELVIILNRTYKDTNVFRKFVKQLPEAEAAKIGDISARIHKAKQAIFEATAHLDRNTWQEIKASAQNGHSAVEATRKTACDIKVSVVELQRESSENHGKLAVQMDEFRSEMIKAARGMGDQLAQAKDELAKEREARKDFEAGLQRLVDELPTSIHEELQGALYQLVADTIVQRKFITMSTIPFSCPPPYHQVVEQQIFFTQSDIINILRMPDPTGDAERILRKGSLMSDDALGYARLLKQKPQFKQWLSSDGPCLRLVDGCSRDEGVGRTSPMSFFMASFASTLLQTQTGIVLQFFCGHHTDPQSNDSGPKSLLRSIISQLLLYPKPYDLVLDFVDQSLLAAVAESNTEALCYFFESLFWRIDQNTTVYILVDTISDFESDLNHFGQKLDRVLDLFRTLMNPILQGLVFGPKLKLLMTSPNRSHRLVRKVDVKENIRLHSGIISDSPRAGGRFATRRIGSPRLLGS